MKKSLGSHNKYLAVVRAITADIRNGVLPENSDLPNRSELCERYALSPVTAHKVQKELELQGLIAARPGKRFRITGCKQRRFQEDTPLRHVVLLGSPMPDTDFDAIADGVLSGCREHGLAGNAEFLTGAGDAVRLGRAFAPGTGVVALMTRTVLAELAAPLVEQNLPAVTINSFFPERSAVLTDNRLGMKELLDYISKNGAQRVLLAGGFGTDAPAWEEGERLEAFRELLKTHELSGETDTTGKMEPLQTHIRRFRPDVLMFTRDSAALHFRQEAGALPLLVTGFGGCEKDFSHLTTIRINFREIGRCAVDTLAHSLWCGHGPLTVRVPGYLAVRH